MFTIFSTASTNFADQQASYTSDFQRRLAALNEASSRAHKEEQARKAAQIQMLDDAFELALA